MKRFSFVLSLLLVLAVVNCSASTLMDAWNDLKAQSDVHLADNVQPATFYDFNTETTYAGFMTCVYSYRVFEAQVGGVKKLSAGTSLSPVVAGAIRIEPLIAKYMDWLPGVIGQENADPLSYLRVGPFYSYDFKTKEKYYGIFGSLSFGVTPEGE